MDRMIVSLFSCLAYGAIVSAQADDLRPTLPELVRQNAQNPVVQVRNRELIMEPIEQLLPRTARIVYGRVSAVSSHLSTDKKDIITDYRIEPIRVIGGTSINNRPGSAPAVVVSRWGGTLEIDGVTVKQIDQDAPVFENGEEVVLLLKRTADGTSQLVSSVLGMYIVTDGRLIPLAKESSAVDRMTNVTVAEFEREVLRLGIGRR